MKRICIFLCLLWSCLCCFPAWAQDIEKKGRVEFSPLGGIFFKNDFILQNDHLVDQSSCYFAGGRVAIYINSRLALEGTFIYSFGKGTIVEEANGAVVEEDANSRSMLYAGNIIYHLGEIDLVPFIAFGAGLLSYRVPGDSSFPIQGNNLDINVGGGVKYYMWEYFAFRADFRFHSIFPNSKSNELPGFIKAYEFSGGISVSF